MRTIKEVKQSVDNGIAVIWSNENYEVIKDYRGQYLIHSISNDVYVGLTEDYNPESFFIKA